MSVMERVVDAAGFRVCSSCGYVWRTREEFLLDPGIELLGLQAADRPDGNLLVFEHRCGGSLSLSRRVGSMTCSQMEKGQPSPSFETPTYVRGSVRA